MSGGVDQQRWLVSGLASGISGLLFGLMLSSLVVLLLQADIGWVKLLERRGIDATMRAAVLFRDAGMDMRPQSFGPAPAPITFVDIDEPGCRALSRRPVRCDVRGMGQADVLVPLGHALRDSGAAALVLDVTLPTDDPAEATAAFKAWSAGAGAPVIAALPGVAGANGVVAFDWANLPGRALRTGRLRFGSAIFPLDKRAGDGVIRSVPASVPFSGFGDGPRDGVLPTLPTLVVERLGGTQRPDVPDGGEPRIFFSLPSLADASSSRIRGGMVGSYARRRLSDMIDQRRCSRPPCPPMVRATDLEGQIVVVGSSAAAAQDWHLTPLGLMPGAEVQANAIRAAQAFPPLRAASLFEGFWRKAAQTLLAATIMTGAWLLIAWLRWRRGLAAPRRRRQYTAAMVAAFIAGSALTLVYSLYLGVSDMIDAPAEGHVTDLLLPTLAVLFEGFLDFAKYVTNSIDKSVGRILCSVVDRIRRDAG